MRLNSEAHPSLACEVEDALECRAMMAKIGRPSSRPGRNAGVGMLVVHRMLRGRVTPAWPARSQCRIRKKSSTGTSGRTRSIRHRGRPGLLVRHGLNSESEGHGSQVHCWAESRLVERNPQRVSCFVLRHAHAFTQHVKIIKFHISCKESVFASLKRS